MKSAIEEILFGKHTMDSVKPVEEEKALRAVDACEDALERLIKGNSEIEKAFENYNEATENLRRMCAVDFYKSGFRFGFRLALDVLKGENPET